MDVTKIVMDVTLCEFFFKFTK